MRDIAAVLFEGFEMLDLYGPLEMFSMFRDEFRIFPIAETSGPISASGGPATIAEIAFVDRTQFDMILVPGGAGVAAESENPAMLEWLGTASTHAEITMSVCTGSLLLGAAGLLNGRKATTNKRAFDWVENQVSKVDWQRKARWVEAGDFFTASGVSAGIDMSLAVIERLLGSKFAQDAGLWAEYLRNEDSNDDPFSAQAGA